MEKGQISSGLIDPALHCRPCKKENCALLLVDVLFTHSEALAHQRDYLSLGQLLTFALEGCSGSYEDTAAFFVPTSREMVLVVDGMFDPELSGSIREHLEVRVRHGHGPRDLAALTSRDVSIKILRIKNNEAFLFGGHGLSLRRSLTSPTRAALRS